MDETVRIYQYVYKIKPIVKLNWTDCGLYAHLQKMWKQLLERCECIKEKIKLKINKFRPLKWGTSCSNNLFTIFKSRRVIDKFENRKVNITIVVLKVKTKKYHFHFIFFLHCHHFILQHFMAIYRRNKSTSSRGRTTCLI